MTYAQAREVIRDCCTGKGINGIKAANKEVKKYLDVSGILKTEDQFSTVVWYEVVADDEFVNIGYDFWNDRIEE